MISIYAIIQISLRMICHFFFHLSSITLLNIYSYHSVTLNEVMVRIPDVYGDAGGILHPFWPQLWKEH